MDISNKGLMVINAWAYSDDQATLYIEIEVDCHD